LKSVPETNTSLPEPYLLISGKKTSASVGQNEDETAVLSASDHCWHKLPNESIPLRQYMISLFANLTLTYRVEFTYMLAAGSHEFSSSV
jgi:hypothetical protein